MSGTVKKDKQRGTWYFVVDVPTPDGARKQLRRRGFATKQAGQAALNALVADITRGEYVEPSGLTVAGYLRQWLASLPATGRRPSTVESYTRNVEAYVVPALGHVPLQKLTALHLDGLYSDLAREGRRKVATTGARKGERGLSLRSVRYVHSIVGKALADAERKGLVQRNVARFASPPAMAATKAPEMHVWTPDELRRFLDATAAHHHGVLFRVAAMTGLRRAELCGLRWSDVDLDAGTLTVQQATTTVRGRPVTGKPKTARGRRTVSVDAGTVAALRLRRRQQAEHRLLVGAGWRDTGLVFTMPDGAGWNPDTVGQAFERIVARLDVPSIRFHDLRHTHATHLLAAGTNVRVVSERLGHASVAFTLDVYGHTLPGQQADAAAAVARLVEGL